MDAICSGVIFGTFGFGKPPINFVQSSLSLFFGSRANSDFGFSNATANTLGGTASSTCETLTQRYITFYRPHPVVLLKFGLRTPN
jgi:hypothetical protein